jgi:hypothetical protein
MNWKFLVMPGNKEEWWKKISIATPKKLAKGLSSWVVIGFIL